MPETAALHCEVAPTFTVDGLQVTWTDVMADGDVPEVTVIDALPDFVGSSVLVAVMTTEPALAGAVKLPLELMLPPLADHVTAEL